MENCIGKEGGIIQNPAVLFHRVRERSNPCSTVCYNHFTQVFFANLLTSLFPTLPMMRLELSELSRDQNQVGYNIRQLFTDRAVTLLIFEDAFQVDRYKDDPLVYLGGVRVSMLTQLLRLCDDISKILPEFDVPIFVAHSEKDTLTDISGSKLLVEVVSSKDITTRVSRLTFQHTQRNIRAQTPDIDKQSSGRT